MGILNKIGAFFYTRKSPNLGWIDYSTWGLGESKIQPTDFDRQVLAYRDTVFSCVNINATAMAGVPLRLYVAKGSKEKTFRLTETKSVSKQQKDYLFSEASLQPYLRKAVDVEEVIDHPFFDLLRNVNGFNNQFDLKELTTIFLELTGNGYWYLPKNGLGVPSEIWVLYSQWMKVIPDPKEFIKGYLLERGMKSIKFEESEVVHFKYPSPSSEFYGMGPLMGAANAYNLEKDMTDYEKAMFENMGRPDIALLSKTGGLEDVDKRKRLGEMWKSAYGGPKKAGKVAVLQGDLEVKEFGFAPREMSYLAGRKKSKEQIANAFGIPMSMLTTEAVNLANAQAGNYQHAKNAILPRCRRFEEKLNEKLLPIYDEKLFVAFDNPVPEDKEFRLKEIESHIRSFYSNVNKERQIDGLEEVPWGDDILVPMNLMPLGQPAKGVFKEKKEFDDLVKDVAREIAEKLGDSPANDEKLRERKWQIFIRRQSPYERKFITKLKELFGKQEAEVLANMKRSPKAVKADWEEDWLFNEAEWVKIFGKEGRPFIGGVMESVGRAELADLAVGIDFDIDNPRAQRWLGIRLEQYSKDVNDTTLKALKGTLREGVAAGESIPDLRKRVQDVFDGCSRYRAQMISRTETITASGQGSLEAYRQSGVVEKKEWLTAPDACDICLDNEADGKIGLEEKFSSGDSTPTAHPNCKCALLPVVEE